MLGREQQILDGSGNATLQQDRLGLLAELVQQAEVLHVARAHLQNVGIARDQGDLGMVDDFAHHQQAVALGRLTQQDEPLFTGTFGAVRRFAAPEDAGPEGASSGLGRHFRRALQLLAAFHSGRAGQHHHPIAADLDAPIDGAHAHHRTLGAKAPAGQLVRRCDAMRFLHAIHHFEDRKIGFGPAAHSAKHGVHHAGGAVYIETHVHHAVDNGLDLFVGGAGLHHDYHLFGSVRFHADALDAAHLVDDALEDAAQRGVGERPLVGAVHVGEDQLLAFRLVDRQPGFALHPTDVFHHTGPLVEQLNDAAIDFVDVLAQLVQFQARLFFGHALTLVTGDSKPALSWRAKSSRCAARFGSFP